MSIIDKIKELSPKSPEVTITTLSNPVLNTTKVKAEIRFASVMEVDDDVYWKDEQAKEIIERQLEYNLWEYIHSCLMNKGQYAIELEYR